MDGAKERWSDRRSNEATEQAWISLYIKTEKRKKKNSNCVGNYGWSERVTEKRSTERRSDGATYGQSDGAKSDGATEQQMDRATDRRETERRSDVASVDKSVY